MCPNCRRFNESQMAEAREFILIVGAFYLSTYASDIYDFIYYKIIDFIDLFHFCFLTHFHFF